jgi:hypothetical protein
MEVEKISITRYTENCDMIGNILLTNEEAVGRQSPSGFL